MVILILIALVLMAYLFHADKTGGADDQTYCVIGDLIPHDTIAQIVPWREVTADEALADSVTFLYYDGISKFDSKYHNIHAEVRPWLDYRAIWDKAQLHEILMKKAPDTICRTMVMTEKSKLPPGVWMIRSNLGTIGLKSRPVDNQADYLRAYKDFTKSSGKGRRDVIIASEYIIDPMLYLGKKFHLRVYMIITADTGGRVEAYAMRRGLLIPALKPYVAGQWNDHDIHDSHGKNNPDLVDYPSATTPPGLMESAAELLGRVMRVMKTHVRNYPETLRLGYEVTGVDVMFDAGGRPYLIEINGAPNISKNEPELLTYMFTALTDVVLFKKYDRVIRV